MNRLLNGAALGVTHWIYPANRPSAIPFQIRRYVGNVAIRGLFVLWKAVQ